MRASDDQGRVTICKDKKRRRVEMILDDDDRISNLPDEVVSHILSRLPTKDALKTSVLSRAWEHQWTSIYDFEIDDSTCVSDVGGLEMLWGPPFERFVNSVTRILERTSNSRIRRFCLSCKNIRTIFSRETSIRETWISSVLKRNVEILNINAPNLKQKDSPQYASNWASLSELELRFSCTLLLLANNCFPNLKKLVLVGGLNIRLKAEKISSEGRIILNFPVLEVLVLNRCEWMDVNFVEIHAPELLEFETIRPREPKSYEIRIFGPKLATFRLLNSPDNFYLCTPAVSSAELTDIQPRGEIVQRTQPHGILQRTQKILNQISGLTRLKISYSVVHALLPSKSGLVFPTFNRLTELNLCDTGYLSVLLELLQLLPPLELLYVNVDTWKRERIYGTEQTMKPWPPKIVSNLKKVEFENFKGSKLELHFSKFVLKNAKNLEQMSFIIEKSDYMTLEKANYLWSNIKPKSCIFVVSTLEPGPSERQHSALHHTSF